MNVLSCKSSMLACAALLLAGIGPMASAADISVGNRLIKWTAPMHDQVPQQQVITNAAGKSLTFTGTLFSIKLTDGTKVTSDQFAVVGAPRIRRLVADVHAQRAAERLAGHEVVWRLKDASAGLSATWAVRVRSGCNYLREHLTLHSSKTVDIGSIRMLSSQIGGARVVGVVAGSPIVTDNFFLGLENPMAANTVGSGGKVTCSLERNAPLAAGSEIKESLVVGEYQPGQLRRDFLAYIEKVRDRPYNPLLLYVSWYDISAGGVFNAAQCVKSIDGIGRQLVQRRGVKMNTFLFDDGWDNRNSIWSFNSGFPNGFTPLDKAAAKFHAHLGVWLSPFGGYASARTKRLAYAKAHGYEIDSGGLSLSGRRYYRRFKKVCLRMIKRYGIDAFKFDGIAAGARAAAAGMTLDGDAMLRLDATLRHAEPGLYINQTTGTWPSPFWLLMVDSTWRGGYDHNFIGTGTWCQKWINYRDAATYKEVVERAPLYPLNSLMLHGIIYARFTQRLHAMSDKDFADQVWSYFGTGTQLQELYITPSLLNKNNWDVLARAAKWSRRNRDVLVDTHWIGGNPKLGEVYGWASWAGKRAIITLRNPAAASQSFTLHLGKLLQLPVAATRTYLFTSPRHGPNARQPTMMSAGKAYQIVLQPYQVLVLEGKAAE